MSRYFTDRREAGRQLGAALARFKDQKPVVLAIPRGGVAVGVEVAAALDAPLDIVLVRKIGSPFQPELALGAVVDGEHAETVLNEDLVKVMHLSEDFIRHEAAEQLKEIDRRRQLYLSGRPRPVIEGRTAIVVDDGIATGATVRAALAAVRRSRPQRLVLAVPVASPDTIEQLRKETDEIVCLEQPSGFFAIGQFYVDFAQLTDADVMDLLGKSPPPRATAPADSAA
jgi:putative phosphoribosyl transferase